MFGKTVAPTSVAESTVVQGGADGSGFKGAKYSTKVQTSRNRFADLRWRFSLDLSDTFLPIEGQPPMSSDIAKSPRSDPLQARGSLAAWLTPAAKCVCLKTLHKIVPALEPTVDATLPNDLSAKSDCNVGRLVVWGSNLEIRRSVHFRFGFTS